MKLRYFYKVTEKGVPIAGTLATYYEKPKTGKWMEVKKNCCIEEVTCPECPECEECTDFTALAPECSSLAYNFLNVGGCPTASLEITVNGVAVVNIIGSPAGNISGLLNDLNAGDVVRITVDCGECAFNDLNAGNSNGGNMIEIFSSPTWDEDYWDYNNTHTVEFTVSGCGVPYVAYGSMDCDYTPPEVDAGNDMFITLADDGEASLDATPVMGDAPIVSYLWEFVSGPSTPTITTPTAEDTTVTGLTETSGAYVFKITVTDSNGVTASDTISVTVTESQVILRESDLDAPGDIETRNFICDTYCVKTDSIQNTEPGSNGWFSIKHWATGTNNVVDAINSMNAAVAADPVGGTGTSGVALWGDLWPAGLADYFPLTVDTVNDKIWTNKPDGENLYLATVCLYDHYPSTP